MRFAWLAGLSFARSFLLPSMPRPPPLLLSRSLRLDDFEDSEQNSYRFLVAAGGCDVTACSHPGCAGVRVDVGATRFSGRANRDPFVLRVQRDYEGVGGAPDVSVERTFAGEWENVAGDTWAALGTITDEKGRKVGYFNALEEEEDERDWSKVWSR
jgi:hypothetical protein